MQLLDLPQELLLLVMRHLVQSTFVDVHLRGGRSARLMMEEEMTSPDRLSIHAGGRVADTEVVDFAVWAAVGAVAGTCGALRDALLGSIVAVRLHVPWSAAAAHREPTRLTAWLRRLPYLTAVELHWGYGYRSDVSPLAVWPATVLETLATLPSLRVLAALGAPLTRPLGLALAAIPHLHSLRVEEEPNDQVVGSPEPAAAVRAALASAAPRLRHLRIVLDGDPNAAAWLVNVPPALRLVRFSAEDALGTAAAAAAFVAFCPNVVDVDLRGSQNFLTSIPGLTDDALAVLGTLPHLESLQAGCGAHFTAVGLRALFRTLPQQLRVFGAAGFVGATGNTELLTPVAAAAIHDAPAGGPRAMTFGFELSTRALAALVDGPGVAALRALCLAQLRAGGGDWAVLARLPALRALTIDLVLMDRAADVPSVPLPTLSALTFGRCFGTDMTWRAGMSEALVGALAVAAPALSSLHVSQVQTRAAPLLLAATTLGSSLRHLRATVLHHDPDDAAAVVTARGVLAQTHPLCVVKVEEAWGD